MIVHQQFSCVLTDADKAQRVSARTYVYENILDADDQAISFLGTYVDDIVIDESGVCSYLKRRFELAHQGQGTLRKEAWLGFAR